MIEASYNQALGELKGVYHVKLSPSYFLPHGLLFFVFLLGLVLFLSSGKDFTGVVSAVVFGILSLPFLFVVRRSLQTIKDELKIYDKGFTYKSRKGVQSCLWTELKDGNWVVETDNRELMTSVLKTNGEEIRFAYKMRGLDTINRRYDEKIFEEISESSEIPGNIEQPLESNEPPGAGGGNRSLGALQSVHRIKINISYFVPHLAVFFVLLFGVLIYVASRDYFSIFVCIVPPFLLFGGLMWSAFSDNRDELKIYDNGLTYKTRKGLQTCFWDEIVDYSTLRGGTLDRIKKENGEWINFAYGINGKDDIKSKLRKVLK